MIGGTAARKIFDEVFATVGNAEHILPYKNSKFDFDLVFCDDKTITEINSQYRGKDCPTDVITFALFFDCEDKIITDVINLGEIIISTETAERQAKDGLEKELCTLVAHGILHLLGFDHQTQEDYDFVVSVQNNVCSQDFCQDAKF